jgi:hypothetical protein
VIAVVGGHSLLHAVAFTVAKRFYAEVFSDERQGEAGARSENGRVMDSSEESRA